MNKKKTEKATEVIHQLWADAQENNISINLSHSSLNGGLYKSTSDEKKKRYIPQDVVVCSQNLFSLLNVPEFKIMQKISMELYPNNALWFFDLKDSPGRSEKTIRSLRRKKVLIPTANSKYHIVNPFSIRNGALPKVIAGTLFLLDKNDDFNEGMLSKVRLPASYMANLFRLEMKEVNGLSFSESFL